MLAWCVWLKQSRGGNRPVAEIVTYTLAAWASWQLLFGPGTERLTYMIVAPFAAWAMMTSYLERRNFVLSSAVFATMFILGAGFAERFLIRSIPASVAVQPIGVIMFATWLLQHAATSNPWRLTSHEPMVPAILNQAEHRSAA